MVHRTPITRQQNKGNTVAKNTLGILIPEINNQELEVDIVGRTSLLVKRFDEKTQEDIADKQAGTASRTKAPRKPAEECERARIRNEKGEDCVKAIWFKKGCAAMGGYFGIPRGNVEQGVYIVGDLIPIKYAGKKPIMNTARVRVGQGGMAKTSLAYRPEFPGWSCKLRVGFDASVLTPHQVISLLAHAGAKNGVGEWRPQKGGDYGRFDVFPAGASKSIIAKAKAEAAKRAEETMAVQAAKMAKPKRGKKTDPSLMDAARVDETPVKRKPGRPRKSETNGVATVANKTLRRPRPRPRARLDELVNDMTPAQKKQLLKKLGF
jgi:hypothetical protein